LIKTREQGIALSIKKDRCSNDHMEHSRSFGSEAARYDVYRPTYAPNAVRWALGTRPQRVADLGAGTGILSRLLRDLGHDVAAVEPDDRMRRRLAEVSPGVATLAGTAEAVPLPDRSVDAVVAGQAYHWFDPFRAPVEIARVLRPGGVFAAFWNDADLRVPWAVRFAEIIDGPDAVTTGRPDVEFGPRFGPVTTAMFRHDVQMTPDGLVNLAMTRSPYLVASTAGRRELVDAVRRLITEPDLAGRDSFPMPNITRVYRATARTDPR
jgi:SAM-dependent methyltransferase